MKYLASLNSANECDLWAASTEPAFQVYNQASQTPESQLEFVQSLDENQRHALVSWLLDSEVPSGGLDGVFSCFGLLIPDVEHCLKFYQADKYLIVLQPVFDGFDLSDYPNDHDRMMELWTTFFDANSDLVGEVNLAYWRLAEEYPLREKVELAIKANMQAYFVNG
jgi:hypothetical protein